MMWKLQCASRSNRWADCSYRPTYSDSTEAFQVARTLTGLWAGSLYHEGKVETPCWRYRAVPLDCPEDPYKEPDFLK